MRDAARTQSIQLDEREIQITSAESSGRVQWDAIVRVALSSDAILVFGSNATLHILPRRAFASDAQFAGTGQWLTARVKAPKSSRWWKPLLLLLILWLALVLLLGGIWTVFNRPTTRAADSRPAPAHE